MIEELTQLASGATLELPRPEYIADDLRDHPAIKQLVYRYDGRGRRYYCTLNGDDISWYVSVTSLIEAQRPKSEYLERWRADLGNDRYFSELKRLAAYGTWMHTMWNQALMSGELILDEGFLIKEMTDYLTKNNLNIDTSKWLDAIQEDLLAFAAWVLEYKPVVLAIEPVMVHPDGYAGALDMVCRITITEKGYYGEVLKSGPNEGKPKESSRERTIVAIVDGKSGRKGFYENHEIQLNAYRSIWNHHFGGTEYEVEKIFNLSPKNWRGEPKFSFKDQTDRPSHALLPYIIASFKADPNCGTEPPPIKHISGHVKLGEPIAEMIQELDPATVIRKRISGGNDS